MRADMKGLHQLDAATLMEEMNVINGMIHYGTLEEKKRARKLFEEHYESKILTHINLDAIKIAQKEMGFSDNDIGIPETREIW